MLLRIRLRIMRIHEGIMIRGNVMSRSSRRISLTTFRKGIRLCNLFRN